ncbi:MAG: YraN family protein [Frankiaceae bacterium]
MRVKDAVGRFGEDVAAEFLQRAGLRIVQRNWRCREGELDIVARDGDELVFCEVKARSGNGFGSPVEAVTPAKVRRLRLLAARWLAEDRGAGSLGRGCSTVRFDVVGVLRAPDGVTVEHVRGVL